ncbi:MAG: hypothetical protein QM775_09755 [Pirellulales bacterium]
MKALLKAQFRDTRRPDDKRRPLIEDVSNRAKIASSVGNFLFDPDSVHQVPLGGFPKA